MRRNDGLGRAVKLLWPTAPRPVSSKSPGTTLHYAILSTCRTRSPPDNALGTVPHHTTALRRYHRRHPTRPGRRQHLVGVITPIRQQILLHQSRQSGPPLACSPPPSPPLLPSEPAFCGRPPPGATWYLAPSGPANGLIAGQSTRAVLMHLDMTGINHQPLKVRVIGHGSHQLGPLAVFCQRPKRCAVVSSARSPGAGRAKGRQCGGTGTRRC